VTIIINTPHARVTGTAPVRAARLRASLATRSPMADALRPAARSLQAAVAAVVPPALTGRLAPAAKWAAGAFVLVTPGSFVVLAIAWLIARLLVRRGASATAATASER